MTHNVFISFSSKDIETALRIYEGLSHRAVKCWISSRHVSPGGNYMNEIVSALTSSSVMVLIYSKNANLSKEIERELALAGQHQLTVIPLKIDDVVPSGAFIYSLATSQWIEVFPNIESTLDTVTATIKAITDRTEKFAHEVQQALEEDGVIEPTDQKYLEDEVGVRMGLTAAQSRAIIKRVIGDSNRSSVQDRELEYLKLIAEVLEDGKITSLERRRLADRAKSLGIDDVRAQALLEQERNRNGIADIPGPIAGSLPRAEEHMDYCEKDSYSWKQYEKDEAERLDKLSKHPNAGKYGGGTGQSVDKSDESQMIADNARGGSDEDYVDSDEETPWEYFQLGNMTVGQVLDSPESEELAGYIAFYAIEDEEDIGTVLEQIKKASPSAQVKDVVENYANFLDANAVGEFSVSDARNWSLGRVIKKLIDGLNLDEVQRILDETHGKTKVWKAFVEYWPDTEAADELPDDLMNWDYFALGDMKAGEVLSHSEAHHLIQGISIFAEKTEQTVRKYLKESSPDGLVKEVVKHYQNVLDPDILSLWNVTSARDLALEKVIAQVFEIKDLTEITKILNETHGKTLLGKAFSGHWIK